MIIIIIIMIMIIMCASIGALNSAYRAIPSISNSISVPFEALWRMGMAAMRSAALEAQADIYAID